jgi:hypothetical protein
LINAINLQVLAGDRHQIVLDPSAKGEPCSARPWFYRIPCKYGFIAVYGADKLVAHCRAGRLIPRLLKIPGVVARQRGDGEVNAVFPPERLKDVARLLGARRKRQMSPEERERLVAAGQAHRFRGVQGDYPPRPEAIGHPGDGSHHPDPSAVPGAVDGPATPGVAS